MSRRTQNELKFDHWEDLPGGSRRYWQEIYNDQDVLVEFHEKYPVDKGHRKV